MTEEEIIAKYNEIMARRQQEDKIAQFNNRIENIKEKYDNNFYSVNAKLVVTIIDMGCDGNHPCSHEEEVFPLSKNDVLGILSHLTPYKDWEMPVSLSKNDNQKTDDSAWVCPPGIDPDAFYGNFQ